jgi:cephalosporin-C deacetylase
MVTNERTPKTFQAFRSSVQRPPDFDDFWLSILQEVDEIPLDATVIHNPLRSTEEVDVFEVTYTSLDNLRIFAWYCVPTQTHIAAPFPGLVIAPGYTAEPAIPKNWASQGYAAIGLSPRGKTGSNANYEPGFPGLIVDNITDRNTYAYRGFYIDAIRAIDFLRSRPEVDSSRIGSYGTSQGGALTIVSAALRPDVIKCGAAGAPFLTCFMEAASFTNSYPYEEINEYLRAYPERESAVRETLEYFDCINFAPLVRSPMLVHLGLEDDVCAPETGHAFFNELTCEKELHTWEDCAHDAGVVFELPAIEEFLARHLKPGS